MKIHHDKHHATYVGNINKATEGKEEVPILDLMADALDATPVRNSGGGHYNHGEFPAPSLSLLTGHNLKGLGPILFFTI